MSVIIQQSETLMQSMMSGSMSPTTEINTIRHLAVLERQIAIGILDKTISNTKATNHVNVTERFLQHIKK